MTVITEEGPLFENEDWLVTAAGLEHKTTGYFIERESLGQKRSDGLWTWPLHMAEKSWCAMTSFAEAFSCATSIYSIDTDLDLTRTFQVAHCEVSPWPLARQEACNPSPIRSRTLRNEGRVPMSSQLGSSEKSLLDEGFHNLDDTWRMRSQSHAPRSFSTSARIRSARSTMERATALSWQTPYRIRRTGTRFVRFLQETWNTR